MKRVRCAIYTRKSSEDGLEQEFNSLDAQREACEAYVKSQKAEGWELVPQHYDDGGISGGTLDRPALQKLLCDIDGGKVDQVVVYKIDRLTRSLSDFARIVDRLDAAGASFVSVTQSFNTATSMGRLTLNMLLSFAQFEREVTAERIRDKIAASKKKGMWMGGSVPIGYQPNGRTLVIDRKEEKTIRILYDLYQELGSVREVKEQADQLGLRSRRRKLSGGMISGGGSFWQGQVHHILTNPIYAGRIRHKDKVYEGQHPAIIDPGTWDQVQEQLKATSVKARGSSFKATRSPLGGKLLDETGDRLTPTHSKSGAGTRLRYYISRRLVTDRARNHPDAWRLPAPQLENAVARAVREHVSGSSFIPSFVPDLKAHELNDLRSGVTYVIDESRSDIGRLLSLVHEVRIAPGQLKIALDATSLAERLGLSPDRISPEVLSLTAPFQLRRKGVETRIVIGKQPAELDHILIRNIVKARKWYADIRDGMSFTQIAERDGTSKRRVQDLVDLAFLSPAVLEAVASGTQPYNLTSDNLIKSGFPVSWEEQHRIISKVG